MNPLILSIDLDEWFHGRWAMGSEKSRWKNTQELFRKYYHSDRPGGEIIGPTRDILKILSQEKIKVTFFILGEVATWYPKLVQEIAKEGHEIACHGMHHEDLTLKLKSKFILELRKSRNILEKLSKQDIIGFRSPNLIVTDWLAAVLKDEKFRYDSSVCPARSFGGKYQNQAKIQPNPYNVGQTLLKKGNSPLIEIPIPTFPVIKLPGAVSIATRIFGLKWTKITLNQALKTGPACYYVHPYEFNRPPKVDLTYHEKILFRRSGPWMRKAFINILADYRTRIISAKKYLEMENSNKKPKLKEIYK